MKRFLFDTADVASLERVWNDLKHSVPKKLVSGITTNPAIFQRVNKNSLSEWTDTLKALSDSLLNIAGDVSELHIQFPNSNVTIDEFKKFAYLIDDLGLPHEIFIKLPPYSSFLKSLWNEPDLPLVGYNVTGLSEAGTILKLPSFVNYASIIPGRMLQAGLDYKDHVLFAVQNSTSSIIAGALRDFEQVSTCFQLGAIPTVGLKTWDLMIANGEIDKLLNLEYPNHVAPEFMPPCSNVNTELSVSFFKEMDKYGEQAYADFKNL